VIKVIGFTGLAGSGKSTAARFYCAHHGRALHTSFAEPLKRICAMSYPHLPSSCFYGTQEEKAAPIADLPGWSGRRIMQHIGTQIRAVDPLAFVKMAEHVILSAPAGIDVVVFDDVRRQNEADMLYLYGATLHRLHRISAGLSGEEATHESEVSVGFLKVTSEINNDDSLAALEGRVHGLP
jgi:hypothetical protein